MPGKEKHPDFAAQLQAEMGRKNMDIVVHAVGNDPAYFEALVKLVVSGKPPVNMRASWAFTICLEKYPELFLPKYWPAVMQVLPGAYHPGIRRNILRTFAFLKIPARWEGFLTGHCFNWLLDPMEPIANRVFAMEILYKITVKHPELAHELEEAICSLLPDGSPGIRSRGGKILRLLKKKKPQKYFSDYFAGSQ